MKPYVIVHMSTSIDGRTLPSRWRPERQNPAPFYDRLHEELGGDAWIVGRITGQEFAKKDAYAAHTNETFPREPWLARRDAKAFAVVIDARGKIAWGRSDIGGDPIVVILTEQVSDAHLAGLRADGVSYLFAGETELDIHLALEALNRELGVKRLLLEGGGVTNGILLRAGVVDEVSLLVCPSVDGAPGAPCLFDAAREEDGQRAPVRGIELTHSQVFEGGVVWLRYRIER
ncbi:dihydrofolate reductase family protein [Sorangium sp. So ce693]|uniref:dihydrofolate reductase family protein n=1 Tax=Sorangium sp. So ce693 TaxID=3133318 RepID=UPI003F5E95D1